MKVLLIGSGGREHALAWKLAASPLMTKLYAAPGNPGIAEEAEIVDLKIADHAAVAAFCKANQDRSRRGRPRSAAGGRAGGRSRKGRHQGLRPKAIPAQLEGSKSFTKQLCAANKIPTAGFAEFHDAASAKTYVKKHGAPIVVKADGLHAGKGVVVAMTEVEAFAGIDLAFQMTGNAKTPVVLEEFLAGEEASLFFLVDGEHV